MVAENGKIFAAPLDADYVLDIDSTENEFTATHIGTNLSSSDSTSKYRRYNIHYNGKYRTSAVAGNGKIYAAPYTARKVLDIDPRRNEVVAKLASTDPGRRNIGKYFTLVLEIDPGPPYKTSALIKTLSAGPSKSSPTSPTKS